jgi:putative redox protein
MRRAVTVRAMEHLKTEIRIGPHVLLADEPADKGGTDTGATPGELLLAALGA